MQGGGEAGRSLAVEPRGERGWSFVKMAPADTPLTSLHTLTGCDLKDVFKVLFFSILHTMAFKI